MKGMKIGKKSFVKVSSVKLKVSPKFPQRNKMFLTEKQKVSHRETKGFSQGNKVFFIVKQIVLSIPS